MTAILNRFTEVALAEGADERRIQGGAFPSPTGSGQAATSSVSSGEAFNYPQVVAPEILVGASRLKP